MSDDKRRYMRHNIFNTDDGPIMFQWPDPLTSEEIADLEELLAIWLRGLKRRAES